MLIRYTAYWFTECRVLTFAKRDLKIYPGDSLVSTEIGLTFYYPLKYGDRIILVQHIQYHRCWCPGSLRRQHISTHDIEYIEHVSSCFLYVWGRISTTFVMSIRRNYINCRYIVMFPMKHLARRGPLHLPFNFLNLWETCYGTKGTCAHNSFQLISKYADDLVEKV